MVNLERTLFPDKFNYGLTTSVIDQKLSVSGMLFRALYICSSCNMGTSDLPEIYTLALCPSASVYISGKSQVPIQLIHSTWVNHLQVYMETVGMLCECIYMGPCDFRVWVTS